MSKYIPAMSVHIETSFSTQSSNSGPMGSTSTEKYEFVVTVANPKEWFPNAPQQDKRAAVLLALHEHFGLTEPEEENDHGE